MRDGRKQGYTRRVARLMRPLASLLAVTTTVATPAVLAACLALCMPGMPGHAMAASVASASPADAGCPDHTAAAPIAPAVSVTASGAACCVDGLTSGAPSVAAERVDTRVGPAGVVAPVSTWTLALPLHASVHVTHDRGSPPPPLRRPSVLRI